MRTRVRLIGNCNDEPIATLEQKNAHFALRSGPFCLRFQTDVDFEFDRGRYQNTNYSAVEICVERSRSSQPNTLSKNLRKFEFDCKLLLAGSGEKCEPDSGVYLITACQVAREDRNKFLDQFADAAGFMQAQPGFSRYRLFHAIEDNAPFCFVNFARWRSPQDFVNAFQRDEFKRLIRGGFDQTSQIIVTRLVPRNLTTGEQNDLSH